MVASVAVVAVVVGAMAAVVTLMLFEVVLPATHADTSSAATMTDSIELTDLMTFPWRALTASGIYALNLTRKSGPLRNAARAAGLQGWRRADP